MDAATTPRGFRAVMGYSPLETVQRLVCDDRNERRRRDEAFNRRAYFYNETDDATRENVQRCYDSDEMRAELEPFVPFARSQSIFSRVCNEVTRLMYAVPPTRTVKSDDPVDAVAFGMLAAECHLDAKLDLAAKLAVACNDVLLFARVSQRLGLRLDVLTPDQFSVIGDPDDGAVPLAIVYDARVGLRAPSATKECRWVYWDDVETFAFDRSGVIGTSRQHGLRRMPFVPVHVLEPSGEFFNESTGTPLVRAQDAVGLTTLQLLYNAKVQGNKQIAFTGPVDKSCEGQVWTGARPIYLGEDPSARCDVIDRTTAPAGFLSVIDALKTSAANAEGISIARWQSRAADTGLAQSAGDITLLERRAELIKVFRPVELDLFDVIKMVSAEHPQQTSRVSEKARMSIDFAEVAPRVDAAQQIQLSDEKCKRGWRNALDDIRAENPEITTDEEALAELENNLKINAKVTDLYRRTNAPANPADGPGQTPEQNGAMGPIIRDAAKAVLNGTKSDAAPLT